MIVSRWLADTAIRQPVIHPDVVARAEEQVPRIQLLLEEALDDSFPASDPLSSLRFD